MKLKADFGRHKKDGFVFVRCDDGVLYVRGLDPYVRSKFHGWCSARGWNMSDKVRELLEDLAGKGPGLKQRFHEACRRKGVKINAVVGEFMRRCEEFHSPAALLADKHRHHWAFYQQARGRAAEPLETNLNRSHSRQAAQEAPYREWRDGWGDGEGGEGKGEEE